MDKQCCLWQLDLLHLRAMIIKKLTKGDNDSISKETKQFMQYFCKVKKKNCENIFIPKSRTIFFLACSDKFSHRVVLYFQILNLD